MPDGPKHRLTAMITTIFRVQCFNTICMHVNSVPTGKRHDRVWDVNSKLATGNVVEEVAKESTNEALEKELAAVEDESFNRMVSAKAPKHVHYSLSGNLNYRVAASVAKKNTGHRYLVNLASAEVREGVSYQTGCSLDAAISDDIQFIPAPVITPEYLPVEPKTLNDSCMTYFEVETTGLEIHNTVLVGHNSKVFDISILITALEKHGLLNYFMSSVKGFIDALPLYKECIPNQPSYAQPKIYNTLFGELYSAHDSMEDIVALRRLFEKKISPSLVLKSTFSGTNESVMQLYLHRNCTKGLLTTMRPLTNYKIITNCMATKIASSGLGLNHLKTGT
ncbi:unnamed protein product [Mytilus coruscus]|uniref:PML C-terminal domain-containing protein n=1 Tax=Mytilus coruscus TaxID=42192 RepID=A0A6J8EVV1_MYTCO|nr:unnamed protein product [Mytilus coruscus]